MSRYAGKVKLEREFQRKFSLTLCVQEDFLTYKEFLKM